MALLEFTGIFLSLPMPSAVRLTHLLVFLYPSALSSKRLQPFLLVLVLLAAQHTQHVQVLRMPQQKRVLQQAQLSVPSIRQVDWLEQVCVHTATEVQQVSPQDVFLTEHQLVVKQEVAALLRLTGSHYPRELAGVDELGASR